ncbi:hypothetical protein BJF84_13925 [Rhodococcus sp. CUA-806]|nr:hypothetical protein BJF84_13925 [Rhodococcus sp. CUA-806]
MVVHRFHQCILVGEALVEVPRCDACKAAHASHAQLGFAGAEQVEAGLDEGAAAFGDTCRAVHSAVCPRGWIHGDILTSFYLRA